MTTPSETTPSESELLVLATPYGLHAVSDAERADIDGRVAGATDAVAVAFTDEVRGVREVMAVASTATAVEPPARLRAAILTAISPAEPRDNVRQFPWRTTLIASIAAAIVAAATVFGVQAISQQPTRSVAEQIMSAPDVRTVTGELGGGTATLMFSRDRNAGMLVMNNVPAPSADTVYQLWLLGEGGAKSAGTMNAAAVTPSATAALTGIAGSRALAFTVEPGTGSPQPTTPILAQLSLR